MLFKVAWFPKTSDNKKGIKIKMWPIVFESLAGWYCADQAMVEPTGMCTPGFFCIEGSSDPAPEICPAGRYCPEGKSEKVLVEGGLCVLKQYRYSCNFL